MKKLDYTDKKIIKKTIIGVIAMSLVFSPSILVWAEDYPAEYLGPGHREYLSGKIQRGYYVEEFTKNDRIKKEQVEKRNQIEEMLVSSYQATPKSTNGISNVTLLQKYNSDKLKVEIAMQRGQREKAAAAQGEFTYIPYSDGKKIYFKDGLPSRIENERVLDEFGNIGIKNTHNMTYNDKRLLISYEATFTDNLGNTSQLFWYGAKYTADSLFYGGKDTVANKNLSEYYLKEIDSAGNVRLTHWTAGSYEGKLLRAFSQTIEDSIYGNASFTRTNITYAGGDPDQPSSYHEEGIGTDGLAYTLDRTNITYNDKVQLTGYHEEKSTLYPAPEDNPTLQPENRTVKTVVDTQFEYLYTAHQFGPDVEEPDPDRVLESIITATTENPDGSIRTETTTTTYDYDAQLTKASGNSLFFGQEADWFDEETQAYKEGNKFTGTSEIQYEILYGKPMTKQVDSLVYYYGRNISANELLRIEDTTIAYENGLRNNLQRVLSSQEHAEVTYPLLDPDNTHNERRDIGLTYIYDVKGNLTDVLQSSGRGSGWEYSPTRGWYGKYTSTITEEYEVILGKPIRIDYYQDKVYE